MSYDLCSDGAMGRGWGEGGERVGRGWGEGGEKVGIVERRGWELMRGEGGDRVGRGWGEQGVIKCIFC